VVSSFFIFLVETYWCDFVSNGVGSMDPNLHGMFILQSYVNDDMEDDESDDGEEDLTPSRVQRFRSLYLNLLTVSTWTSQVFHH